MHRRAFVEPGWPRARRGAVVVPRRPDRICASSAASAALPIEVGARHGRALAYGIERQQGLYKVLRGCVEHANARSKDPAHQDLEGGGRRRLRGFGAQSLLAAIIVMAANLRKLQRQVATLAVDRDGQLHRLEPRTLSPRTHWRADWASLRRVVTPART